MYKRKIPRYIEKIIKDYPRIASGRKNFRDHDKRIIKTIELIKNYFNFKF